MFPYIRPATDQDVEAIAALTRAAWADKVAADSAAHLEDAARVQRDMAEGGALLLVEPGSHRLIGSARWAVAGNDDGRPIWEMMRVGIVPAWRGRGHASLLIHAVLAKADAAGVAKVRIGIRHDQARLLDYYAAYGFVLEPDAVYGHANPANPPPWVMARMFSHAKPPTGPAAAATINPAR